MPFKYIQNKLNVANRAYDLLCNFGFGDDERPNPLETSEIFAEVEALLQELRTVGWDSVAEDLEQLMLSVSC